MTIDIGDNIILAKLAIDNEAKHNRIMRAQWTYTDVETKVWAIKALTEFWSIGICSLFTLKLLSHLSAFVLIIDKLEDFDTNENSLYIIKYE